MTIPLLQRLIHENADVGMDSYILAIKEDVEALLNSFSAEYDWHADYHELNRSLLNFGMHNYLKKNYNSLANHAELCADIKRLLELKEPRLQNLNITAFDESDTSHLILYVRITAEVRRRQQTKKTQEAKSVVMESQLDPLNMSFKLL